jgi:hypothetical protein
MADLIPMLAAVAGQAGEEADEDFNQTVLLLHGDGTNGAQNNTFLDGSTNNFTITRNGNTTQGTFSPFSGPNGYWSNFFDGTNDRLTIADNAALRPGTSAFTIEAWVYRAAAGAAHTIFAKGASTPTGFAFLITSSDTLRFTDTSTDITSTGTVAANTWVHVAAVREGTGSNQLKLYINGVQDGTGTSSTNFTQTEEARIGENRGATDDFNGYISNFRYVIGTALYTAGFTPSTSPLTTTSQGATSSEVELLTCQSNRFLDNSTNAFTVSRVNDVRVTPFSPFAPSAAYSASTNGGSGYFDGSGDALVSSGASVTTSVSFGTGDFTVSIWYYPLSFSSSAMLADLRSANGAIFGFFFVNTSGNVVFFDTAERTSSNALTLNAWNYITWTRLSGTIQVFIGTTSGYSSSMTSSLNGGKITVGGHVELNGFWANGYISDLRILKGTGYSSVTIPTAPLTSITNTEYLLNFTNAGIFDNTGKNNLETVGDAQIDTGTKKYGTGSMEFDGTGDYLLLPNDPNLHVGSGDFTIEFWAYFNNFSASRNIIHLNGNTGAYAAVRIGIDTDQKPYLLVSTNGSSWAIIAGALGSALSTATWYHIALTRSGSNFKVFVDGTQAGSTQTASGVLFVGTLNIIGATNFNGFESFFNGFIDDLRITKGVARYTANFTPPIQAFPDQ